MSLIFSNKAGTLKDLKKVIQTARIAQIHSFSVSDWQADSKSCLLNIDENLGKVSKIVRSSCAREDNKFNSNAGAFLSIPNVDSDYMEEAIERVIESYGEVNPIDEILVQPMLTNVVRAGVAFTHDPNTCSPYRIINWSEGTNTTEVTGGMGGKIWQQAANSPVQPPKIHLNVVSMLNELLKIFENSPLDCEFAVTLENGKEILWLLQVRPLNLSESPESEIEQYSRLKVIEQKVERGMHKHPFLMGRRTVYGVMPDWNPAEIVGIRPKPLSLSLYRELVTDSTWAYQRHNYGYRNLRSFPLMPHFFGLPYIDVRLSFNSFIPSDLDEGLAGRLVDHYIDLLLSEPELHDKIEFEIVFSCYTLDLPERLESIAKAGFSGDERETIANSLRKLTNRIVHPKEGLWQNDAAKLNILNERREQLLSINSDLLERIYWLLEDAKRYGTLPFAGLARAGFIAIQMLKSFVSVGVFSQEDYDSFLGGISTITSKLTSDWTKLDRTTFLSRYGHLRPGTYDILSPRYDEAPELYFDWDQRPKFIDPPDPFSMTLIQMREIVKLLKFHGLHPDPVGLFDFLQAGIELRELAKFHFTRNLSDALALITELGDKLGFSPDDLAYSDIGCFKEMHVAGINSKELLLRSIEQGKARYAETLKLTLPPVISNPKDVWTFKWPDSLPNFITQKQLTAKVVGYKDKDRLADKIVCIPNADPGYDWLFSHSISGLITAWGGSNSHMAIRAGEMGLPAVIGAGENNYKIWSAAKLLYLDCAGRRVDILE